MKEPKGWLAIKTVWYVIWSAVFILGCMISVFVLFGAAGSDGNQWLVGLFGLIVFWYACSTYHRKATELMDKQFQKEKEEDDEHGDDSL